MTYTGRLAAVLSCFNSSRGALALDGRTLGGVGQQGLYLTPPFRETPLALLKLLADRFTFRLAVLTRTAGGQIVDLPVAVVCFRPATAFSRETRYTHQVTSDGAAAITAALATMPPATFVIDGGPEVVAGWRLTSPITDLAIATSVLQRLAERLGAPTAPLEDAKAFDVPLAGVVRNWGDQPPLITVVDVDPTRVYDLDALFLEHDTHADTRDLDPQQRPRRSRSTVRA